MMLNSAENLFSHLNQLAQLARERDNERWLPASQDDEWAARVQVTLRNNQTWDVLWQLCRAVSPRQALPILSGLTKTTFKPAHNVALYHQACEAALQCNRLPQPMRWVLSKTLAHHSDSSRLPIQLTSDGRHLVSGHFLTLLWWTLPEGDLLARSTVKSLRNICASSADGAVWVTFADKNDRTVIQCYTANSPTPSITLGEAGVRLKTLAVSTDGKTVFHSWKDTLYVWNVAKRAIVLRKLVRVDIAVLAASADGRWLATASDRRVLIWELPAMKIAATIDVANKIRQLVWFADSHALLVCSNKKVGVTVWDIPFGKLRWQADSIYCEGAAITPDNRSVLICDRQAIVWCDAKTGAPEWRMPVSADQILFHPNEKRWITNRSHAPWYHLWGESRLYAALHRAASELDPASMTELAHEIESGALQTGDMPFADQQKWVRYCQMMALLARHDDIDLVDSGAFGAFDITLD